MSRHGLVTARVRLAKRGGEELRDYWEWANGYLPASGRQCVALVKSRDEWTFIHVPSGFMVPGLYSRTLKGAAPVLISLADDPNIDRPHSEIAGQRVGDPVSRDAWIAAVSRADTSGLEPVPLAMTFGIRTGRSGAAA